MGLDPFDPILIASISPKWLSILLRMGGLLMAKPRHLLTSLLVLALLIAPLPATGQEGVNSDDGAGSALPLERPLPHLCRPRSTPRSLLARV